MQIHEIVNLNRYPLDRLEGVEGERLVNEYRQQLSQTGACLLPDFLLADAVTAALNDVVTILPKAYQVDHAFAYDDVNDSSLSIPVETLPPDHPRRFPALTYIRFLAKDLISQSNPVKTLFHWQPMTAFIGAVMEMQGVYIYDCPLSGCVFTVAEKDELQDWHFDGIDFIVTLMLQAADNGGRFEYVPGLRSADQDDDFDAIRRVLQGDRRGVKTLDTTPGTLTLFKGRYNLHRASPVVGEGCRVMAILSYADAPGGKGSDEFLKLFYGRSLNEATTPN